MWLNHKMCYIFVISITWQLVLGQVILFDCLIQPLYLLHFIMKCNCQYGNTGFSLVTDLNKGCSLLIVLKPYVWRRVVGLATNILIGTSVWSLEGANNSTQKRHLTLFWSYIHFYSKNSDFENGMKCWGAVFFLLHKM